MTTIAVTLLLCATFLVIVGGLSWTGRLPGNGVIGIRVPEVRKSKELWDAAHRVAGPLWTLAGAVLALGSVLAFSASGWQWLVVLLSALGCLVFLGIGAGMGAHTVALIDARASTEAQKNGGSCGCCSDEPAPTQHDDPSADCGVSGGCGSCSLNGACEGGSAAYDAGAYNSVDLDAVRKAAAKSDET